MTISERFVSQCSPVIGVSNPTCGSVTRASIAHLTATQLESLFKSGGLWADLDFWLMHQIEMQACGIKRDAFYDWITATADRTSYRNAITGMPVKGGKGLLYPFIFAMQRTVVNPDLWQIINGCIATTGGGSTGYTISTTDGTKVQTGGTSGLEGPLTSVSGGTRVIRVDNRYGMPMDAAFFKTRDVIHIFNKRADGRMQNSAYKVISAAADDSATYIDVLLADQNAGSTTLYDAAPVNGYIMFGVNNVNDFESQCANKPTIDDRKRVMFFYQTMRSSRCVDSEYRAVFARLLEANPAFKEFGDLPMSERNAQDEADEQRRFVNAFLFNKKLQYQDKDNWESLEAINSTAGAVLNPGMSAKIVARRANFEGVREQLYACSQVKDLKGLPLNLDEFLRACYDMKRTRETGKRRVTDLDFWTSTTMAEYIRKAFYKSGGYYDTYYGGKVTINVEPNKMHNQLGIMYETYKVSRPSGVNINIITCNTFDDLLAEAQYNDMESAGNYLLCLDLGTAPNGTMYWAEMANNRKNYSTATIEELAKYDSTYRCTMAYLSQEQNLNSRTGTLIVECPAASLWIENIALAEPSLVVSSGPNYGNLYND